jgi:hypothetical protein
MEEAAPALKCRSCAKSIPAGYGALCADRDARKSLTAHALRWRSMPEKPRTPKDAQAEARRQRQAAELRANLAKRKAQSRARAAADARGVASRHRRADRSDQS